MINSLFVVVKSVVRVESQVFLISLAWSSYGNRYTININSFNYSFQLNFNPEFVYNYLVLETRDQS